MSTATRPIHRGISDFALWTLKQTKGTAILAGRRVQVLDVKPCMTKGEGWYNVQVCGENSTNVCWMDVTTAEYEQRRQHIRATQEQHRRDRKRRRNAWE